MRESWIAALAILLPSLIAWMITGRLARWRLPRGRWAELLATVSAAFVAYQLGGPFLDGVIPPPWSGVVATTVAAAATLWILVVVTAPSSAVAVIDCCSGEVDDEEVAALLRQNAGTRQTPGPPFIHPYTVTLRVGGAIVWVWDHQGCPEGTRVTIKFKGKSPFPESEYTATAPRPVVAKPLLRGGDFPYGLKVEHPDGTTCSVDPVIHGRPG